MNNKTTMFNEQKEIAELKARVAALEQTVQQMSFANVVYGPIVDAVAYSSVIVVDGKVINGFQ